MELARVPPNAAAGVRPLSAAVLVRGAVSVAAVLVRGAPSAAGFGAGGPAPSASVAHRWLAAGSYAGDPLLVGPGASAFSGPASRASSVVALDTSCRAPGCPCSGQRCAWQEECPARGLAWKRLLRYFPDERLQGASRRLLWRRRLRAR